MQLTLDFVTGHPACTADQARSARETRAAPSKVFDSSISPVEGTDSHPGRVAPPKCLPASLREEAEDYPLVVANVNDRWRLIEGKCGLQWVLQYRAGNTWQGKRYHTDRDALLRSVREAKARGGCFTVGEIDKAALWILNALPDRFEARAKRR